MSYSSRGDGSFENQFAKLLDEQLRDVTGDKTTKHVYADKQLQEGNVWPAELIDQLNDAQVLVCLYSPLYFQSEPCRKEFGAFFARIPEGLGGHGAIPILPVPWSPFVLGDKTPPDSGNAIIDGLQRVSNDDTRYGDYGFADVRREGLSYFLPQLGHEKFRPVIDAYIRHVATRVVELSALATSLSEVKHTFVSAPDPWKRVAAEADRCRAERGLEVIRSTSSEPYVYFIVVAATPDEVRAAAQPPLLRESPGFLGLLEGYRERGGTDWKPFWPDRKHISRLLQEVIVRSIDDAAALALELPTSNEDLEEIIKKAEERSLPLFFVVDIRTPWVERYRAALRFVDNTNLPYSAVIMPGSAFENELVLSANEIFERRESVEDPVSKTYTVKTLAELENTIATLTERIRAKYRSRRSSARQGAGGSGPSVAPFASGPRPVVSTL